MRSLEVSCKLYSKSLRAMSLKAMPLWVMVFLSMIAIAPALHAQQDAENSDTATLSAEAFPIIQRVAILDLSLAERESALWASYQRQEQQIQAQYQQKARELLSEYQAEGAEIQLQQTMIEDAAFEELKAEFNTRAVAAQRGLEDEKKQLDQRFAQARSMIRDVMSRALIAIASDLKLDLVLAKDERSIILSRDRINITALVTQAMNENASAIDLETLSIIGAQKSPSTEE
ncbi:MAG: OmpH family outer membrane protein [Alphaproteobacteria bacterium]